MRPLSTLSHAHVELGKLDDHLHDHRSVKDEFSAGHRAVFKQALASPVCCIKPRLQVSIYTQACVRVQVVLAACALLAVIYRLHVSWCHCHIAEVSGLRPRLPTWLCLRYCTPLALSSCSITKLLMMSGKVMDDIMNLD